MQRVGVLADAIGQGVEVLAVRHVELDQRRGLRQPAGDRRRDLHLPPERRQDDVRALLLGQPGHVEGDRGVREDPGDQQRPAVEQTHGASVALT